MKSTLIPAVIAVIGLWSGICTALSSTPKTGQTSPLQPKTAVLICPAQFCVPADYTTLIESLKSRNKNIKKCVVADLPRTEWIKVASHLPSQDFLNASLKVDKTLDWYFQAMENALADIYASEGESINISIIGHSIGGWVSRAYLGGLSRSSTSVHRLTQQQVSSFVTLGTPHTSPSDAFVDQTRGLLKAVETSESCSSQSLVDRGIKVSCVGSSSISGTLISTDTEELVAASSYIPLLGKLNKNNGDGIVPIEIAFMEEPANRIEIKECELGTKVRHAHVLPTPWNLYDGYAPSLALPEDFTWYGSDSVINMWSEYVQ